MNILDFPNYASNVHININTSKDRIYIQDSICDCVLKLDDEIISTLRGFLRCIESTIVLLALFLLARFLQIYQMWFVMERVQKSFTLSERLIRVIHRSNAITPYFSFFGGGNYPATDTIEQLIAEGADVNSRSGNVLPLQCACLFGDLISVKLLLQNGAKVNALDGYKLAPLHYAAEKCSHCVELLLKYGAVVDKRSADGRSPLHCAASKNRSSCAHRLLEAGADPDATDCRLDTPLSVAASKGHAETTRILLEYNCDVKAWNAEGQSALSRAAQTAFESAIQDEKTCFSLILSASGTVWPINRNSIFVQFFPGNRNANSSPIHNQSKNSIVSVLDYYSCNPRTLAQLCRYAIRRNLKPGHVPQLVAELPLPSTLRDYVALKE